jgi:hypothetical protein
MQKTSAGFSAFNVGSRGGAHDLRGFSPKGGVRSSIREDEPS